MTMVGDIDAFCKWFAPLDQQRLLQDGWRHRVCQVGPNLAKGDFLAK